MNDPIATRVRQTMAVVFNIPPTDVADDAEIMQVRGWDSLGHANLMLALEEEFGTVIPPDAQVDLQTFREIAQYFRERASA